MIRLEVPIKEDQIRKLKVGDMVALSGIIVTARDAAHKFMFNNDFKEIKEYLKDGVIYHCGPIVKKDKNRWKFVAAGPTTSIREEIYQGKIIKDYGLRGVIGKGGMGENTSSALKEYGAVYFHAVGGAAVVLASCVKEVITVFKYDEFGPPEAMWVIRVEDFPLIVTMDSHGNSLHREVEDRSLENLRRLLEK